MNRLEKLVEVIDTSRKVIIRTHDFPDHDAVATAYALSYLLNYTQGIKAPCCYWGRLENNSLNTAIKNLGVHIVSIDSLDIEDHQIILVDSAIGNRNVTALPDDKVIAVIDHHPRGKQFTCPYIDIWPEVGACASILYHYYVEAGVEPPQNVASMLFIGLMMDTAYMTRRVSQQDLDAFGALYYRADWEHCITMLRNSLSIKDLSLFRDALDSAWYEESVGFAYLERECTLEVLAIIADFFLQLREVHFVVIVLRNTYEYRLAIRSEDPDMDANAIIRSALKGIGNGGGHQQMAGGVIPMEHYPGNKNIQERILAACRF